MDHSEHQFLGVAGEGGGKGGGAGRSAVEAANTLASRAIVKVIEVLSEGEVEGLIGGAKGIYINDTPLMSSDGAYNFARASWDYRVGLPSQAYMQGFPSVEAEAVVGTTVTVAAPVTRTTSAANIDACRVTIALPQGLYAQDTSSGDMNGSKVQFAIDTKLTASGTWAQFSIYTIDGKTTSATEKQYRVERPAGTGTWDIRVRRLTADSSLASLRDLITLARVTEVQDVKLPYNDTAYVGLAIDAESVGNAIPKRSYLLKGVKVKVPANYSTVTRVYTGTWNGTFVTAWTDNPAWVLYDLLINVRYGMGEFIGAAQVDKFSFYDAAVYADAGIVYATDGSYVSGGVPNGKGGYEPRFTFNGAISAREEAFRILQAIAGSMRASLLYVNGQIKVLQDRPASPIKLITKANVLDGHFDYKSTGLMERHTAFNVTFNDREDRHLQRVTTIEDSAGIARYGYNTTDIAAFGATTEGQAIRHGKWALDTELNQTELVQFKMSLNGFDLMPHDIVSLWDEDYIGVRQAGRIVSVTGAQVTLDRQVTIVAGSSIDVVLADGKTIEKRVVTSSPGSYTTVTVATGFSQTVLPTADFGLYLAASPRQFRVIGIKQDEAHVISVEAVFHDPNKFSRVETGISVPAPVFSVVKPTTCNAPTGLVFREIQVNNANEGTNGLRRTLLLNWVAPTQGAVKNYLVRYRLNNGEWLNAEPTSPAFEVNPAFGGTYEVDVSAISTQGNQGPSVAGTYTVTTSGGSASTLGAPTTLQVNSGGTTFGGQDINFQFTNPTSNASVLTATLRDFEVRFIETTGSTTVRTVYLPAVPAGSVQTASYTYAMNVADGGPRRAVQVQVRCRDAKNNLSNPVTATFTNPAPAALSGISLTGGIGNIKLSFVKPAETDLAGVLLWRSTTSGFTPAAGNLLYETGDNYISDQVDFGTTYYYKLAAYDTFSKPLDGAGLNVSTQISGASQSSGGIPEVSSLPAASGYTGPKIVVLTSDGQLYSYISGAWQATIPPVSGVADGSITIAKFASGLRPVEVLGSLPTTGNVEGRLVHLTGDNKLYRYDSATSQFVKDVDAVDLVGTINVARIGDASLTATKFAADIEPYKLVTSVPTTLSSRVVFNTTDGKLYRWTGSAYIASVPAADLTGQVTSAQLFDGAVTTLKIGAGQVTAALTNIAAISPSTGNLTANSVTASTIAAGAVVAGKLAADSVVAANIVAGSIVAGKLDVNSVNTANIVAGAITTDRMSANSINGDRIAANSLDAGKITAASITSTQLAAGAVTASKLFVSDFENLCFNGKGASADGWFGVVSFAAGWGSAWDSLSAPSDTAFYFASRDCNFAPRFPCKAGDQFWAKMDTVPSGGQASLNNFSVGLNWKNALGNNLGWSAAATRTVGTSGYATISGSTVAPAGTAFAEVWIQIDKEAGDYSGQSGVAHHATNIEVRRKNAGNLIVDGAITANLIAADTITGDKIRGNTITGDKISANSVNADRLVSNSITSGQIQAGAIGADQIAADAISTGKLLVTGRGAALNDDPSCSDISAWSRGAGTKEIVSAVGDSASGATRIRLTGYTEMSSRDFGVSAGRQYRGACWARSTGPGKMYLRIIYRNSAGEGIGYALTGISHAGSLEDVTVPGTWTRYIGYSQAPAGAVTAYLSCTGNYPSGGISDIQDCRCEEYIGADLIVDGAISARHVAADSITSAQIAANAITSSELAANSVIAGKILAGTVTASEIAAGTITGDRIAANTVTGDKFVAGTITATQLAAGAVTATKISVTNLAAINASLGNVSGGQYTTGAYTGYGWPAAGAGGGSYLGPAGLLLGSANDGKYFQVEASGNVYTPQFSIVSGAATFSGSLSAASGTFSGSLTATGVITAANIAANSLSQTYSASSSGASASVSVTIPSGARTVAAFALGGSQVHRYTINVDTGKGGSTPYTSYVTSPANMTVSASGYTSGTGSGSAGLSVTNPSAATVTFTATRSDNTSAAGAFYSWQGNINIIVIVTNK